MMYPGGCNHQIGGPPAKLLPWQHGGAASQRRQQPPWSSTVVDFLTLSARMNIDFGPIQLLCSVPTLYHHTIWPDLSAACRRRLDSAATARLLGTVSCASSTDEDTAGWLKGLPVSIEATPIVGAASGSTPDIPLDTPTTSPHHSRPGSTRSRNTIPVTEGITNHLQTPERKDEHDTLD
jgi:hypothetical protein